MMEATAMIMVDEVLPMNRKKLPLAEALAASLSSVDIETLKPENARATAGRLNSSSKFPLIFFEEVNYLLRCQNSDRSILMQPIPLLFRRFPVFTVMVP